MQKTLKKIELQKETKTYDTCKFTPKMLLKLHKCLECVLNRPEKHFPFSIYPRISQPFSDLKTFKSQTKWNAVQSLKTH